MSHEVDAIYDHGVFRPLEPLVLIDGAHVHLRIEEMNRERAAHLSAPRVFSPRLVPPEQAIDFEMDVREVPATTDWLLACPDDGWFQPLPSESIDTL